MCFSLIDIIFYSVHLFIFKGAGWAFQCANKLLKEGEVDNIVFLTESEKSVNMAKELISFEHKDRLIIPGKSYVNDTEKHIDSMSMRDPDEMSTAVSEWLVGFSFWLSCISTYICMYMYVKLCIYIKRESV